MTNVYDFDPNREVVRESTINAIQGLDDDPDEAQRALAIQRNTGYPATVAVGDIDNVEKNYKARVASSLVRDSKWMQTYVDAHPLAPALASDDHDKLHEVGTAVDAYTKPGTSKNWGQLVRSTFMRGVEEEQAELTGGAGQFVGGAITQVTRNQAVQKYLYEREKRLSKLVQDDYPLSKDELNSWTNTIFGTAGHVGTQIVGTIAVIGAAVAGGAEVGGALALGGISFAVLQGLSGGERTAKRVEAAGGSREDIGNAFADSFAINMALARFRGIQSQKALSLLTGKAEGEVGSRAARMAWEAAQYAGIGELANIGDHIAEQGFDFKGYRPNLRGDVVQAIVGAAVGYPGGNYIRSGKNIPSGMSAGVDELKAKMAEVRAKDFDEAVKAAQASAARERDPWLFANAMRQHTKATIDISANAIRKIYGEERPYSEDGKVGWIPNLEQQLDQAPSLGGHVTVPVADWVAHSTPEIQEALRDDIRHDDQGMTVREAEEWGKAKKAQPTLGELVVPSEVKEGEILPPEVKPIKSEAAERLGVPNWADVHGGLRAEGGMTVSERVQRDSLGPMWKALEERGVPYEQLMRLNPREAYQLMKSKTINLEPQTPVEAIRAQAGLGWLPKAPFTPKVPFSIKAGGAVKLRGDPRLRTSVGSTTVADAMREASSDIGVLGKFKSIVMNAINKFGGNVPVHVLNDKTYQEMYIKNYGETERDNMSVAFYDPVTNQIAMHENYYRTGELASRVMFHEAVHAATSRLIYSTPEVKDRIRGVMVDLEKQNPELSKLYGYTDEHEFIAETFTNPKFQAELAKTAIPHELATELGIGGGNWLDAIIRVISQVMGIPQESYSGFEAALRLGFQAMETRLDPVAERYVKRQQQAYGAETKLGRAAEEDVRRNIDEEIRQRARTKTKIYKERLAKVQKETNEQLKMRPDVQLGELFYNQKIGDQKVSKPVRLNPESLKPEEIQQIPGDFIGKGVNPEDLAQLFGFASRDDVVNSLIEMEKRKGDKDFNEYKKEIAEGATESRMESIYGDDARTIIRRAKDGVLSTKQMAAIHEASGVKYSLKDARARVKAAFSDFFVKNIDSDKILSAMGRAAATPGGDEAVLTGALVAREAHQLEKEQDSFSTMQKSLAKAKQEDIEPEYVDWIHFIMNKVGLKTERTPENIAASIELRDAKKIEDFVTQEQGMSRNPFVPDFLKDPTFKTKMEDMTVGQWRAVRDALKSLASDGRGIKTVEKGIRKFNYEDIRDQMVEQMMRMRTLLGRVPGLRRMDILGLRTLRASSIPVPVALNRIDRDDPHGLFNQFINRPLMKGGGDHVRFSKEVNKDLAEAIGNIPGLKNTVEHDLFFHPQTKQKLPINFSSVLGILQQWGNPASRRKLLAGYNIKATDLEPWLIANTSKEDWARAQRIGDVLEKWMNRVEDRDFKWKGVRPERNLILPFSNIYGNFRGWHNPVKYDKMIQGKNPAAVGQQTPNGIMDLNYYVPNVSRRWLEPQTPYIAPTELSLDIVPERLNVMVRDLAFSRPFEQVSKFFRDPKFMNVARQYLGDKVAGQFEPYLKDIANAGFADSEAGRTANKIIDYFVGNFVHTVTGWNPHTVTKHVGSLAVNSLTEEGPRWALGWKDMMTTGTYSPGQSNWAFARDVSSELPRRANNLAELLGLERPGVEMLLTSPQQMVAASRRAMRNISAAPMIWGDLLTSQATFHTAYRRSLEEGLSHDEAVFIADREVVRSHGSSSITNKAMILRQNGMARFYTSLYSVFNHFLSRNYDMAWKAKDSLHDAFTEGDLSTAKKYAPFLLFGAFSYFIFPAAIEHLVTPTSDEEAKKMSTGQWMLHTFGKYGGGLGIGSRDFVHGIMGHSDPNPGIAGSMLKMLTEPVKDITQPKKYMNKQHAGKVAMDLINAVGLMTGLTNGQMGKMAEFLINLENSQERTPKYLFYPKGGPSLDNWGAGLLPGGKDTWATALTRGTLKERRR